jgi:thymidylate synthase ThyX
VELLFQEYHGTTAQLVEHLRKKHVRPPEMSEPAYERILRARAFDSARYFLPLSTVTSVGQIVSARTLEEQIVRLRSRPNEEIREIGELLIEACKRPAYNAHREKGDAVLAQVGALSSVERAALSRELLRDVRVAPTLVKYADPSPYQGETYQELHRIAVQLLATQPLEAGEASVDLIQEEEPFDEAVNTLLYRVSSHPYRVIQAATSALSRSQKEAILDAALERRGAHDELLPELRVGYPFKFDILIDIGAFRDLHRHRRCVQVCQELTVAHGYEKPPDLVATGLAERYDSAMQQAEPLFQRVAAESLQAAPYVLPLGFRRRALFKMDFAEVQYICELRTAPQGHFAYRAAAYQMFLKVREKEPELARAIRVHESWFEPDPLRR